MKSTKILLLIVLAGFIGSLMYVVFADIPVKQREITKEIPTERFFHDQ